MFNKQAQGLMVKIAEKNGWEPAALLAIAEVESAGVVFWTVDGKRVAPRRFEGHIFDQRLSPAKRKRARSLGLSNPRGGAVKNPRSRAGRVALIERAREIDHVAALESVSYGLGQVMGFHWRAFDLDSVDTLVEMADSGAAGQVELMSLFILNNNLGRFLANPSLKNFAAFAYRYNGKGYKRNRYDQKMWAAFKRWSKVLAGGDKPKEDPRVAEAQRGLKRLDYYKGKASGILDADTRAATKAFQEDHGLVEDGIPGPIVAETLQEELDRLDQSQGDKAVGAGVPAAGAGEMGRNILEQSQELKYQLGDFAVGFIEYALVGLALVGAGLVIYGLWKKYRPRR